MTRSSDAALEELFEDFKATYTQAAKKSGLSEALAIKNIQTLKNLSLKELSHPTPFESFHESERTPFDFYRFGLDFFGPLVDLENSTFSGKNILQELVQDLKEGGNAVLIANHQTEPDPQIISILLENTYPDLAEKMIFVAGHRVTTDPVAIPFSRGRNLICIYSKRHIENPPEKKEEKTLHNRKAIESLKRLFQEGGKCIYVALSGGRDRADKSGNVLPAPFDPSSLELFRLMSKGTKTKFYPFSMKTYDVMPPPLSVENKIGERRIAGYSPVHLSLGKPVDLERFSDKKKDKGKERQERAEYIYNKVLDLYLRK